MRRVLDLTRACFEIVPQTQAEMSKLVGEPFASYSQGIQQYLDQFTKAITEGRDAAATAMKDFVAKASEGAGGQRAAKKENVA